MPLPHIYPSNCNCAFHKHANASAENGFLNTDGHIVHLDTSTQICSSVLHRLNILGLLSTFCRAQHIHLQVPPDFYPCTRESHYDAHSQSFPQAEILIQPPWKPMAGGTGTGTDGHSQHLVSAQDRR